MLRKPQAHGAEEDAKKTIIEFYYKSDPLNLMINAYLSRYSTCHLELKDGAEALRSTGFCGVFCGIGITLLISNLSSVQGEIPWRR